jgi:hypothetical protein
MRNREADFELELTINDGKDEPYDLGNGYGHMAFVVDDIEATRSRIAGLGHAPDDIKQFDREGKNSRGSTSWPIRTGTRPRYWSGRFGRLIPCHAREARLEFGQRAALPGSSAAIRAQVPVVSGAHCAGCAWRPPLSAVLKTATKYTK